MEFGERVKAVRTGAGLTQEQFASRLGVTRQAVSNWENGRNLPDIEVVIAISQTFGVSLDELILGGEDMTRTTGEQNDMADKLIRDGSEGRWMRMSLTMSIVGAVLIRGRGGAGRGGRELGELRGRERHAARGLLAGARELRVCGGGRAGGARELCRAAATPEASDGLVWASREVANPYAGASRDGARAFGSREGGPIFTKRQPRFLR